MRKPSKPEWEIRREISRLRKLLRKRKKRQRQKFGVKFSAKKKGQDEEAKKRLGYTNERSYVRFDGSEVLKGADYRRRKQELAERSEGTCERMSILGKAHEPDCNGRARDPHHIKKRWPKRDDRLSNLAHLSRPCHDAEDPRKPRLNFK